MFLVRSPSFAKTLTLIILGACFAASVALVVTTLDGTIVSLVMGEPPWNFSLSVGVLEAFMSCLFTGIAFLIMWASVTMIDHDVEEKRVPLYYTLICALIAMLCGVVFFDNLFNVFIFIDVSSFAAACIVIIKGQKENLRAGIKYIVLSILGSGFVLMGIVVLFSLTGELSLAAIHSVFHNGLGNNSTAVLNAIIFITIGVGFKSALFPMHIWLPDAHGTAPSPSSAILSSLVLKAYAIFYIKVMYVAIGYDILNTDEGLKWLLTVVLIVGAVAMLAGSIMAIMQKDIKRMIAYSSVAQIGYIFMGIGLGNELGLFAAIFHIFAHAVTKAALFLIAGSIIEQTHNRELDKMGGLGYKMPITITMFTIGALSMVGIPMFIGFNSKWNFAMAIMDSSAYWVMVALALSALLNAIYYLPVIIRAFFGKEAREAAENPENLERPITALLPIMVLSLMVMFFAVWSAPVSSVITTGIAAIWQ